MGKREPVKTNYLTQRTMATWLKYLTQRINSRAMTRLGKREAVGTKYLTRMGKREAVGTKYLTRMGKREAASANYVNRIGNRSFITRHGRAGNEGYPVRSH